MKITVDCNIDIVTVISDTEDREMKWPTKEPNKILHILEEILNLLEPSGVVPSGVVLTKIDEDREIIIAEW